MFTPLKSKKPQVASIEVSRFTDPAELAIAEEIAAGGKTLTRAELLEHLAYNAPSADVVRNMLALIDGQSAAAGGGVAGFRANQAKAAKAPAERRDNAEVDRIMAVLDKMISGQPHIKEAVRRILEARTDQDPEDATPAKFGAAGPSGVGKTELFKALGMAIWGDPDAVVIIPCGQIQSKHDINVLIGAAPGLALSDQTNKISQLSKDAIEKKFPGNRGPKLVLFDEVDKIGNGDPEVIEAFANALGNFVQDGMLRLKNGDEVDLRDSIMGFASNAGIKEAEAKSIPEGEGLRKHFVGSFRKLVPTFFARRIPNIYGFDPHTPASVAEVARKVINNTIDKELARARERGIDAQIEIDEELLLFLGETAYHPKYGAGPVENLVQTLVEPMVRAVGRKLSDEEVWKLELREIGEAAKKAMIAGFRNADGGIPEGVNLESFPIDLSCTNPKPAFFPYAGSDQVPHDPQSPLIVFGSGTAAGRGFMVSKRSEDDAAELSFLKPGVEEAEDAFETIELPPELAQANNDLRVGTLDDRHILFTAVNAPDGQQAESIAYVYDAKKKEWIDVPAPEVPLIGAALVGGEGKALLFGGRVQERNKKDGKLQVSLNPREMNGQPIENQAYLFDFDKKEWKWLDGAPEEGLVGAATAYHEGKAYILGGEELFKPMHSGLFRSQSSRRVLEFDFASESWKNGPQLPKGVAYSTAFVNANGNLQLMGGATYANNGRDLVEARSMFRLVNGKWRSDEMPRAGLCLSAVPEAPGSWVIGPLENKDGSYGFDILRPEQGL